MAGAGERRRIHRRVQRAECRAAALGPPCVYAYHSVWCSDCRAERGDSLAPQVGKATPEGRERLVDVVDLGSTPFLDRMPRESRDEILVNSTKIRYPAGTIAFQPGDPDRADILEKGFARLYLTSSEGRQTTIRYVHPGELMGGMLVMGAVFNGSVQMIVDSTVIHLDLLTVRRRGASTQRRGARFPPGSPAPLLNSAARTPHTPSAR